MTYKKRTAYIAVSFSNRQLLDPEIQAIIEVLDSVSILPLVFVDKYNFLPHQERQMMQQSMQDIDHCDLLIAEASEKAIGIGVEVGYAKAKGKPVLYLRNSKAAHSTTVAGISDVHIVYLDCDDLKKQLLIALPRLQAVF